MLPTEQVEFFRSVQDTLGAYGKHPEQRELDAWWRECKALSLEALKVAFKSHREDPDRGERAPRPVDITRRMKAGAADARRCFARDVTGQCEYPGLFSDGHSGEGPWFCPWHRRDRSGPEASRWIEVSREVPWETANAKRIARMTEEASKAAPVVTLAHTIALKHGNKPWQSKVRFDGNLSPEEERIADQQNTEGRAA